MAEQIKGLDKLRKRLRAIDDPRELLKNLQSDVTRNAKRELRTQGVTKTGNLSRSITPGYLSAREALVVAHAGYARYVEEGTGIYGARHRPIVPKTKKVLAWRSGSTTLSGRSRVSGGKETAGWAFARSVRGRKATPFLLPGAKQALRDRNLPDTIVELWNGAA
jgi:hypothetical protein